MANEATVIGPTIKISGEFRCEEDISILGTVRGRIETSADIFVEEGGLIEAEIMTHSIDVRGTIVGDIFASDRIEIHPNGDVTGNIHAPRVILADGGKYKGNIEMPEQE